MLCLLPRTQRHAGPVFCPVHHGRVLFCFVFYHFLSTRKKKYPKMTSKNRSVTSILFPASPPFSGFLAAVVTGQCFVPLQTPLPSPLYCAQGPRRQGPRRWFWKSRCWSSVQTGNPAQFVGVIKTERPVPDWGSQRDSGPHAAQRASSRQGLLHGKGPRSLYHVQ